MCPVLRGALLRTQTKQMRRIATDVYGRPPSSRERPSAVSLILKVFYTLATQLKLGSVLDHCFCFAEGKYLAWCVVALGGQLRDLGRCHFRLRLHSHMTSAVEDGTAQVDIMVWKSSMLLLCSSKVMCGLLVSMRYAL